MVPSYLFEISPDAPDGGSAGSSISFRPRKSDGAWGHPIAPPWQSTGSGTKLHVRLPLYLPNSVGLVGLGRLGSPLDFGGASGSPPRGGRRSASRKSLPWL